MIMACVAACTPARKSTPDSSHSRLAASGTRIQAALVLYVTSGKFSDTVSKTRPVPCQILWYAEKVTFISHSAHCAVVPGNCGRRCAGPGL